jgi:integrase
LGEADDVRDADGETILSFEQADAAARRWFNEVAGTGSRRTAQTVSDALDAYIKGFTGKSVASTKARIDSIIRPALGHLKLTTLTRQPISEWHKARARSPAMLRTKNGAERRNQRAVTTDDALRARRATANRDLTVLKAALNRFGDDHPGLPVHAWREVKPFKGVDGAKLRYLGDDEARRLVNACDPKFRPMVQAALLTGARYGELASLRVSDFDSKARILRLRDTKAGKPRIVYLEDEGSDLFTTAVAGKPGDALVFSRPDGKRWNASQQARYLQRACANGKVIPPATFHDLRRSYGARLALKGTEMAVIAEALGHADERITRRHYAHLSPSYVSSVIRERAAGLGIVARTNVTAIRTRSPK